MRLIALAFAALLPQAAFAAVCTDLDFEDVSYTACTVQLGEDLRLFHSGPDGYFGSFSAVNDDLAAKGQTLSFAMNAGMYHEDRRPVGLYLENGIERGALVTREGPGNFGLVPNGVFCVGRRFAVIESRKFKAEAPDCTYATQSGPMLVIDGALHPRLIPDSDSTNIRNGVGVSPDGTKAVFVISNDQVNFHGMARLFRDVLGLPNALYFDGSISRLFAPGLDRHDAGFPMGPIVGTVVPKG
jgi:uncharacterized protein YigE (DUF2233 family)